MNGATDMPSPVPLWIAGKEVTTSTTFDVFSPNDGKKLWSSCSASPKEAVEAVEAAQSALKTWRKTKPADIRKILLKAADIFEARQEELSGYMMQETGAIGPFTGFNITLTVENFRDVAGRAAQILGAIPQTSTPGQAALVFKEPYGVNLGIAPWNAPYILGTRAFLYAIVGGNTVVLKGSELSPRTYWAIGSVLKEAGLPDGVLNVIYHRPSDAAAVTNTIIEHPAVRKVNFTGSTMTGSIIGAKAGKELKPILMELGGKASAIVCEDANLENAAMQVALGSFLHAGQICMATERILVNRKIIDSFAEALKGASEKVYAPNGDAPVLVAKAAVEKNYKLLDDAASKGAKVLYGDINAKEQSAYRIRPVIISDVKKEMDIFYTESFGPTVSLIAVDSDEEAIEIANDTDYGLSGAVFTESLGRGLKIAREIDSGAIHINSMSVQYVCHYKRLWT
jgi:acyl-CoA reductase-like NAD-dependent aldehyde dehydrogenase